MVGDALTRLAELRTGSVHCAVTSPPYFGLRDYEVDGQIGLELTPEEYIAALVDVFRELRRVLRSDGTLWLNIGDSYAGSWGAQSRRATDTGAESWHGSQIKNHPKRARNTGTIRMDGVKPKDLYGIPWMLAFALRADGWYLRQDIIWSKPNAMPESVTDRCTKAHESLFLLTKGQRYFYDAEAIAEDGVGRETYYGSDRYSRATGRTDDGSHNPKECNTRNKRSVWSIPTSAYAGAHFATMPPALVEPCILAGTSAKGCCPACGAPIVRTFEKTQTATLGWQPSCACDAGPSVSALVLDPFGGAGTVGLVADRLQRDAVLIELSRKYAEMARARIADEAGGIFGSSAVVVG